MINLLYTKGLQNGQICRYWKTVEEFCQESIYQVSMVAYENKLDQRSVFTHYGFEVVPLENGSNGYKNAVLASMNFWLDSLPDTAFTYAIDEASSNQRKKEFYVLLNKIATVPGMQAYRTSANLWNLYNELMNTVAAEPLKLWEPTIEHPQLILKDYPLVGDLLEAAGLLGSEKEIEAKIGAWAFMELLHGADRTKIMRILHDVTTYKGAKLPDMQQSVSPDLYAAIYAFLQGKFYEELNLGAEE